MLKTIKVLLMSAILGLSTAALAVVDINAANQEELQTLKGIGAKKAADIIAYREAHGGFKNVEELLNVKGVGKATLEKLRSEIVVAGDKGVAVESKPNPQELKIKAEKQIKRQRQRRQGRARL